MLTGMGGHLFFHMYPGTFEIKITIHNTSARSQWSYGKIVYLTLKKILYIKTESLFETHVISLELVWKITATLKKKYHCLGTYSAPVSSMIFGTNAMFTKPAQSLAPMMVVHILSWYGYKVIFLRQHLKKC